MLFCHVFEREEFVNARVVDENVERTESLPGFGKQAFDISLLCQVALQRNSLAPVAGDIGDDSLRARFARSVIDDHGCAFRSQIFCDGSAYAFGCAGDDGDFA